MRILVTNDDGIFAPGIAALHDAVADLGAVDVVAPEDGQSAVAHAISVLTPMVVRRFHVNERFWGWSVAGRPADCVKLAMLELLPQRPELAVSGINAGANAGLNVLYSGTVAAAREAALFRVPSVAFSLQLSGEMNFEAAGRIARRVLDHIIASRPAPGLCLSVNIPPLAAGPPRGVRCCPHASESWEEHYTSKTDAAGQTVYWLDGRIPEGAEQESDLAALRDRYVTITPLVLNITDRKGLAEVSEWRWPEKFDD